MKKALCVLLSVCLLALSLAVPVFARERQPYPLVIVRGMDFTGGLSFYPGTPDAAPASLALDVKGVVKTVFAALGRFVTGGRRAAVDAIIDYASEALAVYGMTPDGDSADPAVGTEYYAGSAAEHPEFLDWRGSNEEGLLHDAMERYGAENVYFFKYDWRLDTLENAEHLNELIEEACEDHGTDKVDLVCCSMGGIVTLTYMNYYGTGRLDSVVADSSTMGGTRVTTELMKKQVEFDADALSRFLKSKLPRFAFLWRFAERAGILKGLCAFLTRFADNYKDAVYDGVLTPTFGSMPAVWELVQHEDYEEAKKIMFGGKEDVYAGLLAKADKIQYEVVAKRETILQNAMDSGVKLTFVVGYNTPLTPVYPSAKLQGDGTLETSCMSMGALTSEIGGVLSEADLAVGDPKYVSPDHCINASTCAFPDLVWFVRDAPHVGCLEGSDYTELIFTLLEAAAQPTVYTYERFPQFTVADASQNLSPM